MELLPVELQLAVLEQVSNYKDLISLVIASRPYHAAYLRYKKRVLACVTQATLDDSFVDACMLHLWKRKLNTHPRDMLGGRWSFVFNYRMWVPGSFRHIQLKFLHDLDQYAKARKGDQVKHIQRLLEAEDFLEILSFHKWVIRLLELRWSSPLSQLISKYAICCSFVYKIAPEAPWTLPKTTKKTVRSFYQFLTCVALYGECGRDGRQYEAMRMDFLGRSDAPKIWKLDDMMRHWHDTFWDRYPR